MRLKINVDKNSVAREEGLLGEYRGGNGNSYAMEKVEIFKYLGKGEKGLIGYMNGEKYEGR